MRATNPLSILVAMMTLASAAQAQNPPAPGFDVDGSDPKAIEVADAVMEALGGRKAWDDTQFVTWTFFGRRFHVWDRHSGNIRIEGQHREGPEYTILMNLQTREGRVWEGGEEVTDEIALADALKRGYGAWVNDSYWIFMPYKLKDTGVTLSYRGTTDLEDGSKGDVLGLTFENVGVTPENRYEVFVSQQDHRVVGWSFFREASDEDPQFTVPWRGWHQVGDIMLPTNHGDEAQHANIQVYEDVPASVLDSPDPCDLPGCRGQ